MSVYGSVYWKHIETSFKEERRKAEAIMSSGISVFCYDQFFILPRSTQLDSQFSHIFFV